MRSTTFLCLLVAATGALLAAPRTAGAADFVIIVNKDNVNKVDAAFATRAFRGEAKTWEGGGSIAAVALPDENPVRIAFDREVLGKSPSQSRALWAQLAFSGKAVPPKMVDSDADVIREVAENRNAIGYVSAGAVTAAVKVVK
jgi:ABC-type phosphate transport system substrate-binding protein